MKVPTLGRAEIEQALLSPAAVFDTPEEVIDSPALTKLLKIELLIRWGVDVSAVDPCGAMLDGETARPGPDGRASLDP